METIEQALVDAHTDAVETVYNEFSKAVLLANGDETKIAAAEQRFKKGIAFAVEIYERALVLSGVA